LRILRLKTVDLTLSSSQKGKSSAINRVFELLQPTGKILLLLNGDAMPFPDAIDNLLETLSKDDRLAVVSSYPVIFTGESIASDILRLMW
jgi:cellulose synthase/poly-beta-1,6-N-acetylglucosamine synthase-like glycosyltransferase